MAFLAAAILYAVHPRAQSPADAPWVFEDVAVVPNGCGRVDTLLNGFTYDAVGRLLLGWSELTNCGLQASWGWRTDIGWQTQRFQPGLDGSTLRQWANNFSFALNGHGDPIAIFDSRYADATHPDAAWSFRTNLATDPAGAAPELFAFLESATHLSDLSSGRYVTRTAPDGSVRAARFGGSFNQRVLLEGASLQSNLVVMTGGDYAITPDGADHMVYATASQMFLPEDAVYLRHDASGTTVSTLRADASAAAIAADGAGNLHAFVQTGQQERFGGNLEYLSSADSGATWSAAEIVDPSGSAGHAVAAIDPNGAPAVAYWIWGGGVYYATRASGVWQTTRVWTPLNWNFVSLHVGLTFNAFGTPAVAFFDSDASILRVASPIPLPPPDHAPTLASPGDRLSREGDVVNLPVGAGAADPDHDPLTFAASGLPSGLAINANTGVVSGTLGYQSAGIYPVHLSVSDGRLAAAVDFTWTVTHVACNPIANPDTASTPKNTAVDVSVLDNDVVPGPCAPLGLNLSAVSQPRYGASTFDPKLATVTYTPPADFEGTDFFDYTITNSGGGSATARVTVTVGTTSPILVNTAAWIPQADADCTLRQAIIAANTNLPAGGCGAGGSTPIIIVPPGTYTLLAIDNTTQNGRANGLPAVSSDVTIQGAGAATTIIERNAQAQAFGIFDFAPHGHFIAISGVTVRGGDATDGGAILNEGDHVTLADSWLAANHAAGTGGAYADVDAKGGTLDATGSTFSNNTAGEGGAVKLAGGGSLVNVTVSGNVADDSGGGLWVSGSATLLLRNVTILLNGANAGIGGGVFSKDAPVRLANSIVAGNSAKGGGPDLGQDTGQFDLIGFNFIGNGSGTNVTTKSTGDRVGTDAAPIDPMLAPLADNGGPTQTHVPLPTSPVVDAGNPAAAGNAETACPVVDQRGIARPVDGMSSGTPVCDIGAVEALPAELVVSASTTTLTASPSSVVFGAEETLTVTVSPAPVGPRVPTGSVTLTEGTATLAVVALANGTATFTTLALPIGPHSLSAAYTGDPYFLPSQSAPAAVTVTPSTVTITITEAIDVQDVVTVLPAAVVRVSENVGVSDSIALNAIAPAVIDITEGIGVDEVLAPRPAAMVIVSETVGVSESVTPGVIAPVTVGINEVIGVDDAATVVVTGNTPTGTNVTVTPIDPTTGGTPVSVTFSSVTSPGDTDVTTSSVGPAVPAGFRFGLPVTYFDITTTATYVPPAQVCINYTGITFVTVAVLQILHFENGSWVNRTVSINPITRVICASVSSFSPFVIVEPDEPPVLANVADQISNEGQPVSLQVQASDPNGDSLTFSATGLPPGLSMTTTGLISGTLTDQAAGIYTVAVSVFDGDLPTTQSFRWTVIDMSGRMSGDGVVASGGLEDHFTFTVTERRNGADYGHVEFWIREADTPRRNGRELNRFDAATITAVTFSDDPGFTPGRPRLPTSDTVAFSGIGRWNGAPGYTFEARATDEGEPGRGRDTFAIAIRDARGAIVARVDGTLTGGNIQSERLNRR